MTNGCVRYAALPLTSTAPQADDPCPTTEIGLYAIASSKLRGRTVRVPVRCVAATVRRFRRESSGLLIIDARIPNGRIGAGADGSSELA